MEFSIARCNCVMAIKLNFGVKKKRPNPLHLSLRFFHGRLFYGHADLRISLPEVHARQRDHCPLQPLEGHGLSALWLDQADQETFRFRLRQCRR